MYTRRKNEHFLHSKRLLSTQFPIGENRPASKFWQKSDFRKKHPLFSLIVDSQFSPSHYYSIGHLLNTLLIFETPVLTVGTFQKSGCRPLCITYNPYNDFGQFYPKNPEFLASTRASTSNLIRVLHGNRRGPDPEFPQLPASILNSPVTTPPPATGPPPSGPPFSKHFLVRPPSPQTGLILHNL